MGKLKEYAIGDLLRSTGDVFEQARIIMLYQFSLAFFVFFLLPLTSDILLGYNKAVILHGIDTFILLCLPYILRKSKTIDVATHVFFTLSIISSLLSVMMMNPDRVDAISVAWAFMFLVMCVLMERGKARILFCVLTWVPILYSFINEMLHGALTVDWLLQSGAENPPKFLFFIPMSLGVYAVWRHSLTGQKAEKTIVEQKEIIEEKNHDIIESINYARRLQEAIIPSSAQWNKHLPDSFIMYKPKDIVAGDFYWMYVVEKPNVESLKTAQQFNHETSNPGLILIAAADCTGHGVPGAMVSVICSGALNRAVKEFGLTDPGKILDKTRELVIETFEKSEAEVKDGMDISLCSIYSTPSSELTTVQWADANNPLWYLIKGEGVMKELKPNKMPVGKHIYSDPFTTQTLQLKKGDSLFIFTDGFADQFGGIKGKKYKYKPLNNLLLTTAALGCNDQKKILNKNLLEWKGDHEQVDDILIIGVKI